MRFKKIFIILTFLSYTLLNLIAQETIIDTVYSNPDLDGVISYENSTPEYWGIETNSPILSLGDFYDLFTFSHGYSRSFLSFTIPSAPENYCLHSAQLFVFQANCTSNNEWFTFPVFDFPDSTVVPDCILEHIVYGNNLTAYAFHTPRIGNQQILSNSADISWRTVDVTEHINNDIYNERYISQYRIQLSLDMDDDPWEDMIVYYPSENEEYKPHIVYTYYSLNSSEDQDIEKTSLSIFPNPISNLATISFSSKDANQYNIEIFNLKGQIVKRIDEGISVRGINEHIVNMGDLSNGIYLLKFENDSTIIAKKVVILK